MRGSPYDREILRLAAPALGALAAEPLYVLVDTAIVGTVQLAALAIAATVLSTGFAVLNFLTYGTHGPGGILIGAGDTRFLMWGMLLSAAVYVPVALLALDRGWGIEGVWWGLAGLIGMRALTCGLRFLGSRWVLTGAPA
jgi:Na+-driven multidrug efflux pump